MDLLNETYQNGSIYYIHLHMENIGKRLPAKQQMTDTEIAQSFYADNRKTKMLEQSKNIYKNLLKASVPEGDNNSLSVLNEILKNDDIISQIDKEMTMQLQQAINETQLSQLRTLHLEAFGGKIINQIAIKGNAKKSIQAFNNLLDIFAKSCKLLGKSGKDLGGLLVEYKGKGINKYKSLDAALQRFINENNGKTIDEQRAVAVAQELKALTSALSTGATSKGEELTQKAIRKMVDNIFSAGFAEAIVTTLDTVALQSLDQEVEKSLTGKLGVQKSSFQLGAKEGDLDSTLRAGKADIKLSNVQFSILGSKEKIKLEVGISNKFYRTNDFAKKQKEETVLQSGKFGSGSGGTFKAAIDNVFFNQDSLKYLAYNTMAYRSSLNEAVKALQDLILTRQLVSLFMAREGKRDFSQWILLNGKLVSMWSLLLETEALLGKSSSINSEQALSLSLSGTKEAEEAVKERAPLAWERSRKVNDILNNITIRAHIHVQNLRKTIIK